MTISAGQIVFACVLWGVFIFQLGRAILQKRIQPSHPWRVWLTLFLGCLTFTLWGENIDLVVEMAVRWPLSIYIKFGSLVLSAYLYYQMLCQVDLKLKQSKLLTTFAPVVLLTVTAILIMPGFYSTPMPPHLRLMIVALRDMVIIVYALLAFIPANMGMYRREAVTAMKVKHGAVIAFFAAYIVSGIGNILVFLLAPYDLGLSEVVEGLFHPVIYLCALPFTVMLIPHRWLLLPLQMPRLYLYYRLHILHRQIAHILKHKLNIVPMTLNPFKIDDLEMAIYEKTIAILDHYPELANIPEGRPLYEAISRLMNTSLDYNKLVRAMVAIRVHE